MDDIAIRVDGLGKRFRLRHAAGRSNYRTLRDELRGLPRRLLAGLTGRREEREEFWALKDVSFEVKRGEVLGIIGRNGAGKSTLLKVLSRIMDPTCGEAVVHGRIGSLLEVGTGFHPELTGRENIFLSGALLGMRRDEVRRRFDEIVAFAGVEKFLDTPCKHYSSGMYARLGFAVAAHLDAEILLVDEVLAVGDAEFQKRCMGKMGEVSRGGRTVLFVSHNLAAVQELCGTALCLHLGTVANCGAVSSAVRAYLGERAEKRLAVFEPSPSKPAITRVAVDAQSAMEGNLVVDLSFQSPFVLSPPVPGLVVSSEAGGAVFGSNVRFHPMQGGACSMKAGTLRFSAAQLPLAPGRYRISVWLGDWHADFDEKLDVIDFDFRGGAQSAKRPPSSRIGHLDWNAQWSQMGQGEGDGSCV